MSNTPQKICFRYDGSDEADKAIGLINNKFARGYSGIVDRLYDSDGFYWEPSEQRPEMTLVPPSEFIRLMKGEEFVWKEGDKCCYELFNTVRKGRIVAIHNNRAWFIQEDNNENIIIDLSILRPIRKSLSKEVSDVLYQILRDSGLEKNLYKSEYPDQTVYPDINSYTDRIIQLIKERGVEG